MACIGHTKPSWCPEVKDITLPTRTKPTIPAVDVVVWGNMDKGTPIQRDPNCITFSGKDTMLMTINGRRYTGVSKWDPTGCSINSMVNLPVDACEEFRMRPYGPCGPGETEGDCIRRTGLFVGAGTINYTFFNPETMRTETATRVWPNAAGLAGVIGKAEGVCNTSEPEEIGFGDPLRPGFKQTVEPGKVFTDIPSGEGIIYWEPGEGIGFGEVHVVDSVEDITILEKKGGVIIGTMCDSGSIVQVYCGGPVNMVTLEAGDEFPMAILHATGCPPYTYTAEPIKYSSGKPTKTGVTYEGLSYGTSLASYPATYGILNIGDGDDVSIAWANDGPDVTTVNLSVNPATSSPNTPSTQNCGVGSGTRVTSYKNKPTTKFGYNATFNVGGEECSAGAIAGCNNGVTPATQGVMSGAGVAVPTNEICYDTVDPCSMTVDNPAYTILMEILNQGSGVVMVNSTGTGFNVMSTTTFSCEE